MSAVGAVALDGHDPVGAGGVVADVVAAFDDLDVAGCVHEAVPVGLLEWDLQSAEGGAAVHGGDHPASGGPASFAAPGGAFPESFSCEDRCGHGSLVLASFS